MTRPFALPCPRGRGRKGFEISGSTRINVPFDIRAAEIGPTSARSADMASCCHLEAESGTLPRNKQRCRSSLVRSDHPERATWSDKGRLQIEFRCRAIPSSSQFFGPSYHRCAWPCSGAAPRNRPFRFRQLVCAFRRCSKCLTPPRGKMPVIRQLFRSETYGRIQQLVILQNMKWWPVCRLCFFLAPLPQRA